MQNGSVNTTETPLPGVTSSVNTLNGTVQVQGPYGGSIPHAPIAGKLSLQEAIQRGLQYNLGATGLNLAVRQARGQTRTARSALMPNLSGNLRETAVQNDLAVAGIKVPRIPGLGTLIPTVTPPFNYFDLRATLTQTIADFTALNNSRSASEILKADEQYAQDARPGIGLIGCGGRGKQDWTTLLEAKGRATRWSSAISTTRFRAAASQMAGGVEQMTEFRRVLDRKDLDAVIVAVPDHWHAYMATNACEAGKDVYCEKPLSLTIDDGKKMVAAARRHNRVDADRFPATVGLALCPGGEDDSGWSDRRSPRDSL